MPRRNEHLVVVLVEQAPRGEFVIWPLHITIVPWFHCDDEKKLDELLASIATNSEAFIVKVGEVEHFGNHGELTVNLLENPERMHKLHWKVFDALERNNFLIHQKTFLGEKYKPHITHLGKKHSLEGEELVVSSFTLVKQLRQKKTGAMIKQVVKTYSLR